MLDVLLDTLLDVVKTLPILFIVYIFTGWLEQKSDSVSRIVTSAEPLSPLIGALVGAVPQCGFSVGCTALYCQRFLGPAALVAVFLSTSDEAIPVLLTAGVSQLKNIFILIGVKLIIAIIAGYFLYLFVFRKRLSDMDLPDDDIEMDDLETNCSCCSGGSLFQSALSRTITTCIYLLITLIILNMLVYFVGTDKLSHFLLGGTVFQPVICALIGLIPGCAVSVMITELFLSGAIGFGGAVAGLSAGAGFGFLLLITDAPDKKEAAKIVLCTYLSAVIAGMIIEFIV